MARALVFGNRSRWPLTLGLSDFTQLYEDESNYLFAASLIAIVPVVLLFAAPNDRTERRPLRVEGRAMIGMSVAYSRLNEPSLCCSKYTV
jgi:hypothetical protein